MTLYGPIIWPFQFLRVYLILRVTSNNFVSGYGVTFCIWSELYSEPCQTSIVDLFHKNSYWLLIVNYFPKKVLS